MPGQVSAAERRRRGLISPAGVTKVAKGETMAKKKPDYAATMVAMSDGRTVLIAHSEADALPWVRVLTAAVLTLTNLGPEGRYCFRFDERPELIKPERKPRRKAGQELGSVIDDLTG